MDATIKTTELVIGYHEHKENKQVSVSISDRIYSGELTCLLGGNGVGKSTLLRTLSGLQPKLAGQISVFDKQLESYTDKQLAQIISVVLTDNYEITNMTVEEVVALGRSPYTDFWGNFNEKDEQIVLYALDKVGITKLRNSMIQSISDGERQKMMIARALAQDTPIIFLDEPTAFLDFPSKIEIMQLLANLCKNSGKTIFMSTHDLELALQLADRLWMMDKNEGIVSGTPEDLTLDETLVRLWASENIVLNHQTGLFMVDLHTHTSLAVLGDGLAFVLLCKALKRNGIQPIQVIKLTYPCIQVVNDEVYFYWQNEQSRSAYTSIDMLLKALLK